MGTASCKYNYVYMYLISGAQESIHMEECVRVGGADGGRLRDGNEVAAVALQRHRHEAEERLLDLQF